MCGKAELSKARTAAASYPSAVAMHGGSDEIGLGPAFVPPRLPGRVVVRPDFDRAIDALLADLYLHSLNCARTFGSFQFAISATMEIEPALMRLMYDPNFREFPWPRTRVWMLDEAVGGPAEERRGERLSETILACSGIPESQFHILDPENGGVLAYEVLMREHLEWRERGQDRLDCCLVATTVTGSVRALEQGGEVGGCVAAEGGEGGKDGLVRIGTDFVRGSRLLSVLVSEGGPDLGKQLPAWARANRERVMPVGGEVMWYLGEDQFAAPQNESGA